MSQSLKESFDANDMPRERMAEHGAAALSNAELLAILLRTGSKGENVIQFAQRLLRENGGFRGLARLNLRELAKIKGLGHAKGSQLAATLEVANRLNKEQITATPLNAPDRVYQLLGQEMSLLNREELRVISCDHRLRQKGIDTVSSGTSNQTLASPPEILRTVIFRDCQSFILVHNHPSGDPAPSRADIQFTSRLKQAAEILEIRFVDHVIIGTPGSQHLPYYSFQENGQL